MVKHLIEQKADIEAKDKNGMLLNSATAVLSGLHENSGRVCLWMLTCMVNVRPHSFNLCFGKGGSVYGEAST